MLLHNNHKVFSIHNGAAFTAAALELFHFQYEHNEVYRAYVQALGVDPSRVNTVEAIPFLPVRFFKSHEVRTTVFEPEQVFESSGTTTTVNSHHAVKDISLYEQSFFQCFEKFYGNVQDWCIIGLLPSYLERGHSSLVYMVDKLVKSSGHAQSGFYLHELEQLRNVLQQLEAAQQPTLLIGVTYALLDMAEQFPLELQHTTIMETGGMKGRRVEMVRPALHAALQQGFGVKQIHSEYGMTELLSQGYSKGEGIFECPGWMKILVRDEEDPLQVRQAGNGIINVIDLANIYSCAFIATDDVGRLYEDGRFEVLGRMDGSDIRGCSLLTV